MMEGRASGGRGDCRRVPRAPHWMCGGGAPRTAGGTTASRGCGVWDPPRPWRPQGGVRGEDVDGRRPAAVIPFRPYQ